MFMQALLVAKCMHVWGYTTQNMEYFIKYSVSTSSYPGNVKKSHGLSHPSIPYFNLTFKTALKNNGRLGLDASMDMAGWPPQSSPPAPTRVGMRERTKQARMGSSADAPFMSGLRIVGNYKNAILREMHVASAAQGLMIRSHALTAAHVQSNQII
ncbi:hypothetical protein ACLOJK_036248 [Asimina triloba]